MKKLFLIFLFIGVLILFIFSFLIMDNNIHNNYAQVNIEKIPIKYDLDTAVKNGDVVVDKNKIYNEDNFNRFLKNMEHKKKDQVQIIYYTIEGYPLVLKLICIGETTTLITDNTRNENMNLENQEINRYEVNKIVKKTMEDKIVYVAELEDGEIFDIMYILK